MFVRNAWYVAAACDEITDKPLARTLLNEPVVLFRNGRGEVCALEDRCCHRGAPLSLGNTTEAGIRCGYHGMEYAGDGTCIAIPGQTIIPKRARVNAYPVFEKSDHVWIWMGNADKADPALIVDYPPSGEAGWPRGHDMLHLKAGYVMVLENLMDLSHLSYLHKSSIGSSEEDSAQASMEVKRTPDGMRFLRVMRDAEAPPSWRKRYKIGDKIDRWSDFEYVAPSVIMQFSGGVDAGDYDRGVREGKHLIRTLHAVTPETDTSCFYFYCKADGYARFDPSGKVPSIAATTEVFKEDAFMLEQQQLRLNGFDTDKLIDINTDVARVQMIRALNERLRQDQEFARAV